MSADASGSTAPRPVWVRCSTCREKFAIPPETAERGGVIECTCCGDDFPLRFAEVLGR